VEHGRVELLLLTLVRGPTPEGGVDEAVRVYRAGLRREVGAAATEVVAYDVVAFAGERWVGGGVDVVSCSSGEALRDAASSIARARAQLPTNASVSFRAIAAERNEVRTPPVAGLHTFSSGGMADGFDRRRWQARWREHARLLDSLPAFSPYLTGYVQYHGVDTVDAAALGVDDTNGIAHMTYRDVEERAHALLLPEYLEVLRPDEDEFVSRTRGMRVFAARAEVA
jgi:hypothetical protein